MALCSATRLLGAYLFGSAVDGGLRPASDLDFLVVTRRRTTAHERASLIDGLRPISSRRERPAGWRPIELTLVAQPDVHPWRYPPLADFQSGEWMRTEMDSGTAVTEAEVSRDLAVLVAMVRQSSRPLVGPPAAHLLPEIPRSDIEAAMTDGIDTLLGDLESDTTNVLLTLARIWHTLATTEFTSKDVAAAWVMERAPSARRVLELARTAYVVGGTEPWTASDAAVAEAARELVRHIRSAA